MKYAALHQISPSDTSLLEDLARQNHVKLMQQDPQRIEENRFHLDGNTIIGRSESMDEESLLKLWRERTDDKSHTNPGIKPGIISIKDLQRFYRKKTLDLRIMDDPCLSRRHLLFCIPDEVSGSYYAVDLFSRNGTILNKEFLPPGIPRILHHGDLIMLPSSEGWITFIFKEMEKVTQYEGIIIADPDGTLPGNVGYGRQLKGLLEQRGFHLDILAGEVSRERVFNAINSRAGKLGKDSYMLLMYLGHGSPQGELILKDSKVKVQELYSRIGTIRAKKMMIFDCCYGNHYLEAIPLNSAVAVSNRRNDVSYTGIFTKGMIDELRRNPQGVYFEDLVMKICVREEYRLSARQMEPGSAACEVVYFRTSFPQEQKKARDYFERFKRGEVKTGTAA